jgi:hypothetical protein
MRIAEAALAFAISSGSAFQAFAIDKPIWHWTPSERAAARAEYFSHRTRIRVEAQSLPSDDAGPTIDGRTNPELLMPSELFNALLQGVSDNQNVRQLRRDMLSAGLRAQGIDEPAFWNAVEQATVAYRSNLKAEAQPQRDIVLCESRATALEAMRRRFAREDFDRLLYMVIAPTIVVMTSRNYEDADHLLRLERGCRE